MISWPKVGQEVQDINGKIGTVLKVSQSSDNKDYTKVFVTVDWGLYESEKKASELNDIDVDSEYF